MSQLVFANELAWAVQVAAVIAVGLLLPGLLRLVSPQAKLPYLRTLLVVCLALPALQPWAAVPPDAGAAAIRSFTPGRAWAILPKSPPNLSCASLSNRPAPPLACPS